jgi:hypothetical protein
MEDPDLSEQHDSDPAALALTDLSPKLNEQRLDITPRDSGPHGMRKDGFQGSSVRSSHRENGTTLRYYWQAARLRAHCLLDKGLTAKHQPWAAVCASAACPG